ncbi:MAG TPA: hypothetical protein VD994_11005, partial [Prosthecobacter sp.]|nr:hypothetical protein [Prosthecobacter sp.]
MPLDASSPEFARLATAWLEGTATAEEAAQLWQAVAEDEACAREFSAAARFEALMAETLRERAGEKEFLREMSGSAATVVAKAPPRRLYNTSFLRPLAMAAAFAVLGSMAWLLWPRTEAFQIADSPPPKPKPPAAAVREPGPPVKRLAAVAPTAQEAASAADVPLPERLDRFFL